MALRVLRRVRIVRGKGVRKRTPGSAGSADGIPQGVVSSGGRCLKTLEHVL